MTSTAAFSVLRLWIALGWSRGSGPSEKKAGALRALIDDPTVLTKEQKDDARRLLQGGITADQALRPLGEPGFPALDAPLRRDIQRAALHLAKLEGAPHAREARFLGELGKALGLSEEMLRRMEEQISPP